jgi:hypothetical protein
MMIIMMIIIDMLMPVLAARDWFLPATQLGDF